MATISTFPRKPARISALRTFVLQVIGAIVLVALFAELGPSQWRSVGVALQDQKMQTMVAYKDFMYQYKRP